MTKKEFTITFEIEEDNNVSMCRISQHLMKEELEILIQSLRGIHEYGVELRESGKITDERYKIKSDFNGVHKRKNRTATSRKKKD